MIYMDRTPHGSILINDMIFVGDPPDMERAFPTWSQLVRMLRRGCHGIYEASFLIRVGNSEEGWGSHLLMRQLQPLCQDLNMIGGIINGGRGMRVLYIRREGRLSACRYHGRRKPVWLMGHGVEH